MRTQFVIAPLQRGLAAAESVFGMVDAEPEDDRGTVKLGRARGEVTYEKVGFVYPTRVEPALAAAETEKPGQFERQGYFCRDRDSTPARPVFLRPIGLRDTWAKEKTAG